MKKINKAKIFFLASIIVPIVFYSCKKTTSDNALALNSESGFSSVSKENATIIDPKFNDYWYTGKAEISSYKLEQARYGEIRKGKAVLIYVTEDFLPNVQVKADNRDAKNISVLKLNATKNFNTGIYPYTIMQSTFYPVSNNQHAIKVSSSMQEWCGHVYVQLNNKKQFEITSHSYFEGEADEHFKLEKNILENELWIQLRIAPKSLPTGNLSVVPSFEFTRMKHVPIKAYKATATLADGSYTLSYPDLNRTLTIKFNPDFPYDVLGWEETFNSGFGAASKLLTTKATKLKTIKSPYWKKNHNKHETLRDTLLLN